MNRFGKLIAALVLGAVCSGVIAPRAYAQNDPRDTKITLSLNDADVREALKMLFKSVNAQYSIAPEVQGTVVVDLKEIPFETALRNILDQVKATYRIETGIYVIVMREEIGARPETTEPTPTAAAKKPLRRFKLMHADPLLILMLLTGTLDPYGQPEYSALNKAGGGNGQNGNGQNGYGNNGNGGYGNNNYGGGNNSYGGGGYGGYGSGGGYGNNRGGYGGGGYGGGNGGLH